MTAEARRDRSRSYESRVRVGFNTMLFPIAGAAVMLLIALLYVTNSDEHLGQELDEELTTLSVLRQDLTRASRLVDEFVSGDRPAARAEFDALAVRIDRNVETSKRFDDSEEVRLAQDVSAAWNAGRQAANRLFTEDQAANVAAAVAAVDHFNLAEERLTDLDEASRSDLQEAAEASSTFGDRVAIAALLIGALATAMNIVLVRRLLRATFAPLRHLTDGVGHFSIDDLDRRIELVGDREFQEVGNAFNAMADRLENTLGSLEHQAFHDSLTGLANRAHLVRHLREPEGPAGRALVVFNVDGFKAINDALGHSAGDDALVYVGRAMQQVIGPEDLLARLGADEFAVVLGNEQSLVDVEACARRIAAAVAEPVMVAGRLVSLRVSAGIAASGDGPPVDIIREADIALCAAKENGGGVVRRFHPEMLEDVQRRLDLGDELRTAVANDDIEVHYQPTVSTTTGSVTGVEALARWRHPVHGLIAPARFIPLAESTGLILPLGRYVLRTACKQAKRWQGLAGLESLNMSVNVSGLQLHDDVIVNDVHDALIESRLDPASLTLEVTETVMADPAAVARVHDLKGLGVQIALDDFGTGYSSLSHLQRLPIDILKMDKSFVDDIASGADGAVLGSAIIRLGRSLGLATIAEGVEREEQLHVLKLANCEAIQGFYFARPEPPDAAELTLLRLTAAANDAESAPEADKLVHISVGPWPAAPAREWLQHAGHTLDEIAHGRLMPGHLPPGVLSMMRTYVESWTRSAMKGDVFEWSGTEDADLLNALLRYWLPISRTLADISVNEGRVFFSDSAGQFSEHLTSSLLIALAASDDPALAGPVELARAWPIRAPRRTSQHWAHSVTTA